MTIGQAFAWLADAEPDRLAVRDDTGQLTRKELDRQTNQMARVYAGLGVTQDSMVAVSLPNSTAFITACVAIWKLGATPMPISPALSDDEQRLLLELAQPALVVTGDQRPQSAFRAIGPLVDLTEIDDSPLPPAAAASWKAPTTSGSTGTPKIVSSTAGAWIDPERQAASFVPRQAIQLVTAPLSHSAPFTYAFRGLMTGHTLIVQPRFDEQRVLAEIANSAITWVMLVPTMMSRIMKLPEAEREAADMSSLQSVLHLGAPCSPAVKRHWLEWLGPERITEVYAGTESQGLTAISGTDWLQRPGSVGRPIGGTRMKIVDENGREVLPGTVGEILMTRAGGPTYEYLGGTSRRRGDWDSLGDVGYQDEDGYLYLLDRKDDLIISGGVNIYPAEIESLLEQHPFVRSAVVFGVPDDDDGQAIHAIVDIASAHLQATELLDWLSSRLGPLRRPNKIHLVREPVRNDAGKVRRNSPPSVSAAPQAPRQFRWR